MLIDVHVEVRRPFKHAGKRLCNMSSVVLPMKAVKQMLSFIHEHRHVVDEFVCQATRPIIACLNAAATDVKVTLC